MILEPLLPALIAQVAYNMRTRDKHELAALGLNVESGTLARLLSKSRFGFVACDDHFQPIAVCAGDFQLPGLVGWWFFATARLPEIGLPLTRHIKRDFIPEMLDAGVRRAEARSMAGYEWAADWMRLLGFRDALLMRRYGCQGQDFILWELTDQDVRKSTAGTKAA